MHFIQSGGHVLDMALVRRGQMTGGVLRVFYRDGTAEDLSAEEGADRLWRSMRRFAERERNDVRLKRELDRCYRKIGALEAHVWVLTGLLKETQQAAKQKGGDAAL